MGAVPTFAFPTQSDFLWWQTGRPLAYLYQTTAQTAVPSSTWTAVSLQTALIDRDSGHVGTSGRYTHGLTLGWYEVSGLVAFSGTGGSTRSARLVLNGSVVDGSLVNLPAAGPCTVPLLAAPVHSTSPGDYIELQCYHDAGSPIDLIVSGGECSQMFVKFAGT